MEEKNKVRAMCDSAVSVNVELHIRFGGPTRTAAQRPAGGEFSRCNVRGLELGVVFEQSNNLVLFMIGGFVSLLETLNHGTGQVCNAIRETMQLLRNHLISAASTRKCVSPHCKAGHALVTFCDQLSGNPPAVRPLHWFASVSVDRAINDVARVAPTC